MASSTNTYFRRTCCLHLNGSIIFLNFSKLSVSIRTPNYTVSHPGRSQSELILKLEQAKGPMTKRASIVCCCRNDQYQLVTSNT